MSEEKVDYKLSGWRTEGGDWHDVENGERMPRQSEWINLDLVTINLAPESDDGFYRSANILGGLDGGPGDEGNYTLDDLAYELAHSYGFVPQ